MTWLFIGLVVLVVAAVAAVAVGRGAGLSVAQPDRPEVSVPADRLLTGADIDEVGLSVGLRGYRMDEVDDLLTRLGSEIDERDRRLAELLPAAGPPPGATASLDATAPVEAAAAVEAERAAVGPAAPGEPTSDPGLPEALPTGPIEEKRVSVVGPGEAR